MKSHSQFGKIFIGLTDIFQLIWFELFPGLIGRKHKLMLFEGIYRVKYGSVASRYWQKVDSSVKFNKISESIWQWCQNIRFSKKRIFANNLVTFANIRYIANNANIWKKRKILEERWSKNWSLLHFGTVHSIVTHKVTFQNTQLVHFWYNPEWYSIVSTKSSYCFIECFEASRICEYCFLFLAAGWQENSCNEDFIMKYCFLTGEG